VANGLASGLHFWQWVNELEDRKAQKMHNWKKLTWKARAIAGKNSSARSKYSLASSVESKLGKNVVFRLEN
jgi:hypothetical protein